MENDNQLERDGKGQDYENDSSATYNLMIYGIKKNTIRQKLKCKIERLFGPIQDVFLIPYSDWNIASISCYDKKTYESLLHFNSSLPTFSNDYKIRPITSAVESLCSAYMENSTEHTIFQLNPDCLRQICQKCTLKTQIQLAKVSQAMLDIITDIWFCRYRSFAYELYEFEFKHELTATELQDLLIICGPFVQKLTYNSIFYFPLIQRHCGGGNLMQNGKKFINVNFCKNLPYFVNVRAIEIEGKFLADFTTKEMARYCKQLQTFKLLDSDTRWLRGKHLHLLGNLSELCLKDCENLKPKHMLKLCKSLKALHTLDIRDCKQLQKPQFIKNMCSNVKTLEHLKLTAIENAEALDAILTLPKLKSLQFYWLNAFATFERLYFGKLLQHKCAQLTSLSFSNDRVNIDNESKVSTTPVKYDLMREYTAINCRAWNINLAETEADMVAAFLQFTALREIHFVYCRLLKHESLLDLCRICRNLKLIKFIGCRAESDDKLLQLLQQLRWNGEVTECAICIEGLIPVAELKRMRQHTSNLSNRTERNNVPVMRSILCEFK